MAGNTDAELAFLQSMRTGEDVAASVNGQGTRQSSPAESDEDYDPLSLMADTVADAPPTPLTAVNGAALEPSSRTSSRVSNSKPLPSPIHTKPRTVGGFAVDSSDEDGSPVAADAPPIEANGHVNVAQAASAQSEEAQNSTTPPDVPVAAQDQAPAATAIIPPPSTSASASASASASPNIPTIVAPTPSDVGASAPLIPAPVPFAPPPASVSAAVATPSSAAAANFPKARLPNDRIGMLEDRIADDPRGDLDAWQELISDYRRRNKIVEARAVFDRFFQVFPHAAEQWVAYAKMETEVDAKRELEQIFLRCLLEVPHVKLWSTYLDYVRRTNNINTDTTGKSRQTVLQTFDFVLKNVGMDRDSGNLWQEYIAFVKSGPGVVGGTTWQDAQKVDEIRKAYHKAIIVPTRATNAIWTEYSSFENLMNKMTAKKYLQDRSPGFVQARSTAITMANNMGELERNTLPKLPPAFRCEGEAEYIRQLELWRQWIKWEKEDPLAIKVEDFELYKARVVYTYKHALMAMRFWPELWAEAAEFCFANGLGEQGNKFLADGIVANPESLLLAFKQADCVEHSTTASQDEDQIIKRGDAVRKPYDDVLAALYELYKKAEVREQQALARTKEQFANMPDIVPMRNAADDEDDGENDAAAVKERVLKEKEDEIKNQAQSEYDFLKEMISAAWVALMRAMRRVQGQGRGKADARIGGFRKVFTDARSKGRINSKVYIASALIEYHCYKDPAAAKIFERGARLYPTDEEFALEYLKHLIAINDITNARAVFKQTVAKFTAKPETLNKAKRLYSFFHEYESRYGELNQIQSLEKRMAELWPEEPLLPLFADRYVCQHFDPVSARPIISPAVQLRPLVNRFSSGEEPIGDGKGSPHIGVITTHGGTTHSPKRAFNHEDSDNDLLPPRKLIRGDSPLKGAAGRRMDANRRLAGTGAGYGAVLQAQPQPQPPARLPAELTYLLSIIPPASSFEGMPVFMPKAMAELLMGMDLGRAKVGRR